MSSKSQFYIFSNLSVGFIYLFYYTPYAFLMFIIILHLKKMVYKDHPFECGISSNSPSRKPYSMPFFFYSLIFLMFDLEIILIYPMIYFYKFKLFYTLLCVIIILLLLSLLFEWLSGAMKWN